MPRTPEARTAGQRPFIAAVATVVLLSAGTIAMREQAARIDTDPVDLTDGSGGAGVDGSPRAVAIGPPVGASVADYVKARQQALADAPEDVTVAVVSFASPQLVADAVATVGAEVVVRKVLLRLPLPEAQPIAVDAGSDPVAAVAARLAELDTQLAEEAEQIREQLPTTDDPAFVADFEARLGEIDAARAVAAGTSPAVHGVVVEGPLAALRALQQLSAVRLVDPAPVATAVALSEFHALLPADTEVVSQGRSAAG